jgi:hypothetical protein
MGLPAWDLDPTCLVPAGPFAWHRILQENQKHSATLPRTILFVLNRIGGIIWDLLDKADFRTLKSHTFSPRYSWQPFC